MILRARPQDIIKALAHNHYPKQCGHFDCLWGFSNLKHHPHSGGVGGPARRKRIAMAAKYRKVEKK